MKATSKRPKASADAIKAVQAVKAAPAVITHEQLQEAETTYRADPYGVVRRLALGLLSVPGSELIKKVGESRETAQSMADVLESLDEYIEHQKIFVKLLEAAQARWMVAMAYRDDADELRAAAKREAKAP